jgi:hypothetical protein
MIPGRVRSIFSRVCLLSRFAVGATTASFGQTALGKEVGGIQDLVSGSLLPTADGPQFVAVSIHAVDMKQDDRVWWAMDRDAYEYAQSNTGDAGLGREWNCESSADHRFAGLGKRTERRT